jgi:hypothetical protein
VGQLYSECAELNQKVLLGNLPVFLISVVNQVTKQWVVCIHEIACVTNFSPFQKSTEFIYMRPVSHCLERMAHRVTTFKMCYCWGHVILIKEIDEQYLMRGQLLIYYQYLIKSIYKFFCPFLNLSFHILYLPPPLICISLVDVFSYWSYSMPKYQGWL